MNFKPHVEVFKLHTKSDVDLWDWRLVAANGEIVCSSMQGYTEKNDATEAFLRAQELMDFLNIEIRYA